MLDIDEESNNDKEKELEKRKDVPEESREVVHNYSGKSHEGEIIDKKNKIKKTKPRKFYIYKKGKIKHFNELNVKEEFSFKDMKEKMENELEEKKTETDSKTLINKLIVAFLVFSIIFVLLYYRNSSTIDTDISNETNRQLQDEDTDVVSSKKTDENKKPIINIEREDEVENKKENEQQNLTKDELVEIVVESVKEMNTKELNAVKNYINIKGNRVSTISTIERNIRDKKEVFALLIKNEKLFKGDEETYLEVEELLVKSIAMSEEFLTAFDSKYINEELNKVILKYAK